MVGRVGHQGERDDHGRVAGLGGDAGAAGAREEQGVELAAPSSLRRCRASPPRRMSLSRSACPARAGPSRGPSRPRCRDWPGAYLMAPRLWCAVFHARSSASVFTGAAAPSDASQPLKSRFMPYFSTDGAVRVLALGAVGARARAPLRKLFFGVAVDDARDVGRVDDARRLPPSAPRWRRPSPWPAPRSGRRAAPSRPAA